MRYLIANWKSHKTLQEAEAWLEMMRTLPTLPDNLVVVDCPPWPYIDNVARMVREEHLAMQVGAQDISPFPIGAYTGAVAADLIRDWVTFAIVGHSERRRYFHETHQEVANKVERCVESGISPIVCVDEPYAKQQIAAIEEKQMKKCLLAYEPLEAIGSGAPVEPEHAAKVITNIKKQLPVDVPVLYGGSVKAENVTDYVNQGVSDGVLVGTASLDAEEWKRMVEALM